MGRYSLERVLASDRLPSLPEIALRIVELARADEPDFGEIVQAIKSDAAISSKILKTANSALFGLRTRVSSVEAAVPILGATLVRTLVLSFSLAGHRQDESASVRHWCQRIWRDSVVQASAAEALALRCPDQDAAVWFLAGLLQDIGRLAMLGALPGDYRRAVLEAEDDRSPWERERDSFGFTHVDVGVALCRRWNLEPGLIDAIASHHHTADEILTATEASQPTLAAALAVAAQCADYMHAVVDAPETDRRTIDLLLTERFEFHPDEIVSTLSDVDLRVGEVAASFAIDVGECPPLSQILEDAQSTLAHIALHNRVEAILACRQVAAAREELRQAQAASDEFRESAFRDPLTGVYNRGFMDGMLDGEIARCRDEGKSLGFLFLDLDGFKQLNDDCGHAVGDQALCAVAEVLKSSVRASDPVIRYGGDEFLILLAGVSQAVLVRIAQRIREKIARSRLEADAALSISSSIGALLYVPEAKDRVALKEILKQSDQAMYQAKRGGGNQVAAIKMVGRRVIPFELVAPEIQVAP